MTSRGRSWSSSRSSMRRWPTGSATTCSEGQANSLWGKAMAMLRQTETRAEYAIEKPTTLLGRDQRCDIVLRSRLVSHEHARIHRGLFGYTIEDVGSTHGTYVNGERLRARKRLRSGDVIVLAMAPARRHAAQRHAAGPCTTSTGWGMHHTPPPFYASRLQYARIYHMVYTQ